MSQIFDEKGDVNPVTLIEAGPCFVLQKKTVEKDGYNALQVGFDKRKGTKKTSKGKEYKHIREKKTKDDENFQKIKEGEEFNVSVFSEGDVIKISGPGKSKGFQGAVKRWGFSGRNATHGVKHEHRTLGSTGSVYPQRVIKGRKMPGRMGGGRITVKNLKIIKIDSENNLLAVKGAVPGSRGTLLEIYENESL